MVRVQVYADRVWLEKNSYLAIEINGQEILEGLLVNYSIENGVISNVLIDTLATSAQIRRLVYGKDITAIRKLRGATRRTRIDENAPKDKRGITSPLGANG